MPVRDIVIIGSIVLTIPFCFARPYFGIIVWTIVALLNPHRFGWGAAYNEFPVAVVVGAATLAGLLIFFPGLRQFFSRDIVLMIILWLWFTLTSLHNSSMPEFTHFADDTWYQWRLVSKVLLMILVTVALVNTWQRFRTFLYVMAGCLGSLVLKAVPFMITTGGSFRLYGPDGSMLADNNDLGLALNMTLPLFFFLAATETRPWPKRLLIFVFLSTIPAILFTYSRGALVGLVVVLFLMIIRVRQRFVLLPVILVAVLFAIYFTPEKWQSRMDFRREGAVMDDSALSRINAWTYSWRLAKDYPLFGAGFEAFTPELFNRYAPNPADVHGPHSVYFGVLAEHGFIGLGLYLSLITSVSLSLWQVRRYARLYGDETAANYSWMLQFSIIGFMVSGAFLGRAYFDYFFLIVGCTMILSRLCRIDRLEADYAAVDMDYADQQYLAEPPFEGGVLNGGMISGAR
jgi:probable O-glycosylation ligase (exosortase A-associated)